MGVVAAASDDEVALLQVTPDTVAVVSFPSKDIYEVGVGLNDAQTRVYCRG